MSKVTFPTKNDNILSISLIKENIIFSKNPSGYFQTDGNATYFYTNGDLDTPDISSDSLEELVNVILSKYPNISLEKFE